ncbi:NAD-dependent epimerase/dehydratase family protein [Roseiconus lacunae]|uniref:SDR family oxidoreductase n=1 Tax=Roseiconus lacunae TaxID=2605694 RepID=A0ABT7PQE5_9BACT|nr:NAD-dependent epimerase/dehydratase family protein [Roseiconus lacunae]MDM4018733.1 SDR family oxidoreductase [Roseiconus lacunae]
MRILVSGATGLLGNNIVRQLAAGGHTPVALVRKAPDSEVFAGIFAGSSDGGFPGETDGIDSVKRTTEQDSGQSLSGDCPIEIVESDFAPIADEQANEQPTEQAGSEQAGSEVSDFRGGNGDVLDQAVRSCDAVIHCAAMIHLGWRNIESSMRVNRDGTDRLAQACLRHKKKLTAVGTVNSIALGARDTIADENTPVGHAGGQVPCAYVQSKRAANEVVRRAIPSGLNAVIVHPGFMLGPWDWKPSSGRMLIEVGKGWKPIAPRGGCSVCDSRDVAAGVIAATLKDCEPGREFILAGHNWTYKQLWSEMAIRMGKRPPTHTLGPGVEYLAGLVGDLWTRVSGNETDVNSAQVTMSGQFHWYSSERAIRELGYQIRDADETLDDAARWIQERFVLPQHADNR